MVLTRSIFAAVLIAAAITGTADAQLFGSRSTGQPLQRRVGPARSGQVGEVQGNERFLRGNRGRREFVGSDERSLGGFVGSEQARTSGNVPSSTTGLRPPPDRSSTLNRPIPPLGARDPYHPRLTIGFQAPSDNVTDLERRLAAQLAESPRFAGAGRFEVSVEGRTAILRGEVAAAKDRDLAELVVRFEPGISDVRNELAVVPSPGSGAAPPAAARP
ncbi:MAG: BON domain-containing protein [Planctomycetes bacterium]|nr:BON domain-containing protein [Planctomycetota bacterium]